MEVVIKIEVKDNNIEQALRVLKRKLQRDGLTLREGESFDRQTVQRTLKVIGDGLWAFRGETLESRERAATRTLMLSHVSRHLERFGSADLVIEAAAMVLRSENPRDVVSRIPRVMGTHWA